MIATTMAGAALMALLTTTSRLHATGYDGPWFDTLTTIGRLEPSGSRLILRPSKDERFGPDSALDGHEFRASSRLRAEPSLNEPSMTQTNAPAPRTLDKGDQSNVDSPKQVVVRTAAEWTALWRQHSPDRPMPRVDFSREMVVGMFMGSRPTAGYSLNIVSTIEANGVLHVRYRETMPSRDTITAQILTSPYHLVAVPKSSAMDVKFEKAE